MNFSTNLCKYTLESKWNLGNQIRKIHLGFKLFRNLNTDVYSYQNVESPLWFTNLPRKKKAVLSVIRKRKAKIKRDSMPSGPLAIACKNSELNHYLGICYKKFDVIPLASKNWHHRKSKGDYFTILPSSEHPAFLAKSLDGLPTTFKETGLSEKVIEEINKLGIEYPTVIQMKSIPEVLQGKSVMIAAETGCGKTLAYLAPIVNQVLIWKSLKPNQLNSPFAVILLPTRELAIQVGMLAYKFCNNLDIKCLTLLGGKTKKMLLEPDFKEINILVCTLGVLSKFLTHKIYNLTLCKHLVLDEADTLLDDSFNEKLTYMIRRANLKLGGIPTREEFPSTSQLCLVSATKPRNINQILNKIISEDNLVKISTRYLHKIQPHIPQEFLRIGPSEKPERLLKIMKKNIKEVIPTMIFSNKAATCHWVSAFLNENGIKTACLSGDSKFETRVLKYQSFREAEVNVISCTDISSRGLDCTRVKHVINYDFPRFIADYIHRCGRTGRINHSDNCLITNFISSVKELRLLQEIEKAARTTNEFQNVDNNISKILKNRALVKAIAIDPDPIKKEDKQEKDSQTISN